MSIPSAIIEQLDEQSIAFETIQLEEPLNNLLAGQFLKADADKLLRVIALKDQSRRFFAVLPYNSLLDMKAIANELNAEVQVLEGSESQSLFDSIVSQPSCPPFLSVVKAPIIVDKSVFDMSQMILESGNPSLLIRIKGEDAKAIFQNCEVYDFAASPDRVYAGRDSQADSGELDVSFTPIRIRQRVDDTFDLPAMPEIAQDIMKLRVDPSADATKLAQIVSRDPSLAAQVISWASSPYYGYQGKVDSVETAVARVLGFELVMNLALGISIGKSLKVPMDGPLGVREFWKQAIYCANLSEKLCRAMPVKQRPERGLIYLSGLLHNFGHLLLGHIFPPQFNLINSTILANPQIAVEDIEFYVLGVTHEEIGAWLMQNWHMPDELIVAVHRHHQEEFWSKHAVYSNLVLVSNRLLKRLNIGDSLHTVIPQTTLELLSLDINDVENALKDIELESETLDIMAKQLVA
ncbi:HDOD domain-containing protein [Aliikangiella marina]|uniref:HDOD domain-containing protein n=1 Tax=Aliikangiella marina TaxID=1712262 RepID=A0A545TDH9_9GAMM|nr:HDOD domain-containing protein [Aliikangiella marina]TQV75226.1 HDOD domain-containing protein [Aliikangiella marina]